MREWLRVDHPTDEHTHSELISPDELDALEHHRIYPLSFTLDLGCCDPGLLAGRFSSYSRAGFIGQ